MDVTRRTKKSSKLNHSSSPSFQRGMYSAMNPAAAAAAAAAARHPVSPALPVRFFNDSSLYFHRPKLLIIKSFMFASVLLGLNVALALNQALIFD